MAGPDKARRRELKNMVKGGGLLAAVDNIVAKAEETAPVGEDTTTTEFKPEEETAPVAAPANGKTKVEKESKPKVEKVELPKDERISEEDETEEVKVSELIDALTSEVNESREAHKTLREKVLEMEAEQRKERDGIKALVAEVVNATAEAAVAGAFRKFGIQFRKDWEPRLAEVLMMVQASREESAKAAAKVAETTAFLPALRALSNVTEIVEEMQAIQSEVNEAYGKIAQLLGAPASEPDVDPFA